MWRGLEGSRARRARRQGRETHTKGEPSAPDTTRLGGCQAGEGKDRAWKGRKEGKGGNEGEMKGEGGGRGRGRGWRRKGDVAPMPS